MHDFWSNLDLLSSFVAGSGEGDSGKLRHGPSINHSKSEGGNLSQNTLAVEG